MRIKVLFLTLFTGLFAPAIQASTVVTASSSFTGGLLGSWTFQYVSGDPSLYLQQIKIDLAPGTDLAFDTAPGGFGSLANQDVCCFGGTDVTTGLTGFSPSGAALDGQTEVVFNFNNFLPGDTFQFNADVDHPNPTLLPVPDCTGKKGLALAGCLIQDGVANGTNDTRLLAAQTVLPNSISGATVTFTFGGPGWDPASTTGTFQSLTVLDILTGNTANPVSISAQVVPEPGTMAMMFAAVAALGCRRFLKKK